MKIRYRQTKCCFMNGFTNNKNFYKLYVGEVHKDNESQLKFYFL